MKVYIVLACGLIVAGLWRGESSAERVGGGDTELDFILAFIEGQGVSTTNRALLEAAASHDKLLVRGPAIEVLGYRRVRKATPILRRILANSSEDLTLRQHAAIALARLGDRRGVEELAKFYDDEQNQGWRLYLAARLAEVGDPRGYSTVEEVLEHGPESLRPRAVEALSQFVKLQSSTSSIGGDYLGRLFGLTADPDAEVRDSALLQIGILNRKSFRLPGACETLRARAEAEDEERLRSTAARLAAWICPDPKENRKEPRSQATPDGDQASETMATGSS